MMEANQGQKNDGKRHFNKKKWRDDQYSHKTRVSEWEDKRKLAVQRKYKKMLVKEYGPVRPQHIPANIYNAENNTGEEGGHFRYEPPKRLSEFQRAKLEYERIQQLKQEEQLEREKQKKEREEAIQKSKQVRLERIKKLTQKTKKGQPVMKGRIEILLEKIQKQADNGLL